MANIGILAVQGCIDPHIAHFQKLGVSTTLILDSGDLSQVDAIVLPGGESTTMLRLLKRNGLFEPLRDFVEERPAWGICAGSILLAKEVANPNQESLGAANVRAERNSYGSQLDSFSASVEISVVQGSMDVDFIRAPRLSPLNDHVEVLSRCQGDPVLLRDRHLLCAAFHTELRDDSRLHQFFLEEFL